MGLLIPLSEILELSVTELLEGKRTVIPADRTPEQVEDIVKTAIAYSTETPEKRRASRREVLAYCLSVVAAALELAALWFLDMPVLAASGLGRGFLSDSFFGSFAFLVLMSLFVGAYGTFWAKERLPAYHDEHKIRGYVDGAFRMNVPGLYFNNRNWPHICRAIRIWAMLMSTLTVPLAVVFYAVSPDFYGRVGAYLILAAYLGGLFAAIYIAGKRYE